MNVIVYDNTFEGLITSIYEINDLNIKPAKIIGSKFYQQDLFANKIEVVSDHEKFEKIWDEVKKKTNEENWQRIYKAFLSEISGIEIFIYDYVNLILNTPYNVEVNFSNDAVLKINNAQKKVGREVQRVLMFIRFQKTVDEIFYASFNPKYNVIPLTINHFKKRFTDQKWVIFDTKRKYGYYYDMENVCEITIDNQNINYSTGKVGHEILNTGELLFQKLWKSYYDTINIKERKNMKVHMQFMPKRFWKYLPEKDLLIKSA